MHPGSVKLFSDGSKTSSGVGCAVVHVNNLYVSRLSNNSSIFIAELTALAKSFEIVSTLQDNNFTIYSDSYSALMAIKQYNPKHPIIQHIQEWLYRFASKFKSVHFCLVPVYVGIAGNELADYEARDVITKEDILFHHIPSTDMKWTIRSYVKNKWQARW
ncbi:uncharacterized protein LOC135199637 [Macrobrachium nipponense]|uniref:uncharacterized protein LOC135199637 n=1 Tax=Macrobrachium nipponense TaxID=159736 RepID=UPI0030C83188